MLLERSRNRPVAGTKYLLRESYDFCKDGVCQAQYLTEAEQRLVREEGAIFLTGVIQRADAENGNTRIYTYPILKREIDNFQKLVRENRAYGELDHPDDTVVNFKDASHYITEVWWNGKEVMGKLRVMVNTPPGKHLAGILKDGGAIGLSSRGLGSVREGQNGQLIVEDDFQLICFDVVTEPSTHGAFMNLVEARMSDKELSLLRENKIYTRADKINRLLNDIVYEV